MKTYWSVKVQLRASLTMALDGAEGYFHAPMTLPLGKDSPVREDWVGPQGRSGHDGEEKNSFLAPVGNQTLVAQP
jgi:hypothetical protein